jgi:quercetin dioxygenase-like cupin family protein
LSAFGEEINMILTSDRTDGRISMWEETCPPGGGPPPHYHDKFDEIFHVIEGRVSFLAGGDWSEVTNGGMVFMPRGVVHAFKNVGDKPARMVLVAVPSGLETFFALCAEEFSKPAGPDMPRVMQICRENDVHVVEQPSAAAHAGSAESSYP